MTNPYELPPEDTQYLKANYPSKWRKLVEGNGKYGLLIEDFPIPKGYTLERSTLMVLIPSGYPGSGLDMFYFCPPLGKLDSSPIGGLSSETHFGQTWQCWSRHYPWTPGEDFLFKHIEYVIEELHTGVR